MVEESTLRPKLSKTEQDYAIKTWSYLRIAMVLLVGGLAVSVVAEVVATNPACIRQSISAYYYTPVHNFFVGVLMCMGVCLFCLKGSTELEDTLLNLAGMFAPVVALVPTSSDDLDKCASATVGLRTSQAIENNMTALLVVGGVGLAILVIRALDKDTARAERNGIIFAALVFVAALALFLRERSDFVDKAHWVAAVLMFGCIIAVVCVNACSLSRRTGFRWRRRRYAFVAAAMIASTSLVAGLWVAGWDHGVFTIEAVDIVLFGVFWLVQTFELKDEGLRRPA